MKRIVKISCLLLAVVTLFTMIRFKPTDAAPAVYTEGKVPENVNERLKQSIVLYVGSPSAFVNNAYTSIDSSNSVVKPVIKDGRTLVPVRFIAESLGAKVSWNEPTAAVTVESGGKTVKMVIGSRKMAVGGTDITLEVPAESMEGRTFIPLRALAEALGKKVFYDRGLIAISDQDNLFDVTTEKNQIDNLIAQLNSLPILASQDRLKELLEKSSSLDGNEGGWLFGRSANKSEMTTASMPQAAAADAGNASKTKEDSKAPSYSETNVQVQGVDEADVVKTDGEYIYQVNKQRIIIARAYPADKMQIAGIIGFSDTHFTPSEMFLHDNKLVVIGRSYSENTVLKGEAKTDAAAKVKPGTMPYYYSKSIVKAIVYDITDKSNIKQLREVELEGSYVSSRKIGAALYLVANRNVDYYMLKDNPEMVTPSYRDTAVGNELKTINYNDIRYFPDIIQPNYMIVAGINLDKNEEAAVVQTYLGAGNSIYVSEQNLYVAAGGYRSIRPAAPAQGIMPQIMPTGTYNTLVYKFSLNEGKITYLTKGEVPGNILNQFSMDESKGYFRIATTVNNDRVNDKYTSTNNLYVLDEMLNIRGKVEDIAPGERIYSVRFMGDRAYMVTFKTVDPLFVLDLKDPAKPEILGALKIPGYSNYLHPYDENHIIGFGKDTVEVPVKDVYGREVAANAYYLGMKIAIFDVTDVKNPVEKFSEKIGDRGTDSPLLQDHKALLFDKDRGLLAFPVSVAEVKGQPAIDTRGFPAYGQTTFQGAYVYNIDLSKGFTLRGKITHLSPEDQLKSGNSPYYGDKAVERLLYIGDTLYTLSKGMVKGNDIGTLKEVNKVVIP